MTMEKFKDEMAMTFFGRSAILAKAGSQCVSCGKAADQFRDKLSEKEYGISGLCQRCQDEVFCEDPRDED